MLKTFGKRSGLGTKKGRIRLRSSLATIKFMNFVSSLIPLSFLRDFILFMIEGVGLKRIEKSVSLNMNQSFSSSPTDTENSDSFSLRILLTKSPLDFKV